MTKRMISALIAAVLLILPISAAVTASGASGLIGDADGDSAITILDATAIQRHLAALEQLDASAVTRAKVLKNETLSILDATAIQRYLAGLLDRFPAQQTPTVKPTEAPTQAPTVKPTEPPTQPPTQPPTEAPKPQDEVTKVKNNITVYFSNNKNWTTVNAYIYNNETGTPMTAWPGKSMTYVKINNEGERVYSVTADVSKYDRIIFNNGTEQTTDTPLTKASSGYFINSKKSYNNKYLVGLYPYGQSGEGSIKTVTMDYPDGYKKKIYIWTPEGYDPADKSKKYSVLYMCDGQNLFGQMSTLSGYEWECDETVLSLMKNGGDGVIVVGVDNSTNKRDHELTPNLGSVVTIPGENMSSYLNGGGKVFSDFVTDTVIPYVEKNYHTNSIRGIAGSSSGGIEAFYIGMENMDKFRYVGALSPAFLLYSERTWLSYLRTKDFSGDVPRVYFFCGNNAQDQLEQALFTNSQAMPGWLKQVGYPADKMTFIEDKDGTHSEGFWAVYFPEMLSWGLEV